MTEFGAGKLYVCVDGEWRLWGDVSRLEIQEVLTGAALAGASEAQFFSTCSSGGSISSTGSIEMTVRGSIAWPAPVEVARLRQARKAQWKQERKPWGRR